MDNEDIQARILELRALIEKANHDYYDLHQPTVGDRDYDLWEQELLKLEEEFPEFSDASSQVQNFAGWLQEEITSVDAATRHSMPSVGMIGMARFELEAIVKELLHVCDLYRNGDIVNANAEYLRITESHGEPNDLVRDDCVDAMERHHIEEIQECPASFVAIDFETANRSRVSACSVGLVKVENEQITARKHLFISPVGAFVQANIAIHGITGETVRGAPTFDAVFEDVMQFKGDLPLVGYSRFDKEVLEALGDYYSLPSYDFTYTDICACVKEVLPNPYNYKLDTIARYLKFSNFNHHDAGDDAYVCAQIAVWLRKHQSNPAMPDKGGCSICGLIPEDIHLATPLQKPSSIEELRQFRKNNPMTSINGRNICITGTLPPYFDRVDVENAVLRLGGVVDNSLTKKRTDALVILSDDSSYTSSKTVQAEKFNSQGMGIQIFHPDEFMELVKFSLREAGVNC